MKHHVIRGILLWFDSSRQMSVGRVERLPHEGDLNFHICSLPVRNETEAPPPFPLQLRCAEIKRAHDKGSRSARRLSSSHVEYLADGRRQFAPGIGVTIKMLLTRPRKSVIFGAAIVVRCAPSRLNPASPLQAVQGGVE